MCSLERFKINLRSLTDEVTNLDYDLDHQFFEALDASEVREGLLHVSVSIRKVSGFYEFHSHAEGTVTVTCDRCLDDMLQPIEADSHFVVKLGAVSSEEDEVIIVSEDEGILDMSWLIYESVALAIPIKHVHAPGKCNLAMSKVLEELSVDRSSDEESDQPVDPRWNALKDLKINS